MENMLENQTDQREVYILISLPFITSFKRERRARVILPQRLISRRIQRRRRAAFSQFLTIFAWRQQQRHKCIAWVLPRPQYSRTSIIRTRRDLRIIESPDNRKYEY